MENVTILDLIKSVGSYNNNLDDINKIMKAYHLASELHKKQFRESGEPYIIHPLGVAYTLSELEMDADTIIAGILHDVIEDTNITKTEIEEMFGYDVANLVDGVTKISKMNFSSKEEMRLANTRKIIGSMINDIRIIVIKLADRLHNMRTLQYKREFKQKENSLETMEIFVPIAYQIGAYRIKSELEDISFHYLMPNIYQQIEHEIESITEKSKPTINGMLYDIYNILNEKELPVDIKVRAKNIYGVYKRKKQGHNLENIHDLISFKIMTDEIDNCYLLLRWIHELYRPINNRFKDYICNPKTNLYQSLHTTVFAPDERLIQMQIRTYDMDKIASFGLASYWNMNSENTREKMQEELAKKYQFYSSLLEINKAFGDNKDFLLQIKQELFSDKVYVYNSKGDIIELPKGSTIIDFAYQKGKEFGDNVLGAIVNEEPVSINYILENKDRVKVITDSLVKPEEKWLEHVKTTKAKRLIREYCGK